MLIEITVLLEILAPMFFRNLLGIEKIRVVPRNHIAAAYLLTLNKIDKIIRVFMIKVFSYVCVYCHILFYV